MRSLSSFALFLALAFSAGCLQAGAIGQIGTLSCPTTLSANVSTAFLGPLRHIQAGGVDFAYYRFHIGKITDPTPLVLMMGFGGTMSEWSPQLLELLAQGREVVIFDCVDQGLTKELTASEGPISLQLVTSALAFMDALHLEHPNVVGWSLGGATALTILAVITLSGTLGDATYVPPSPEVEAVFYKTFNATELLRAELFFPTNTTQGAKAACAWLASVAEMPRDPNNPETNARIAQGEQQTLGTAAKANLTWAPGPGFDNPVLLLAGALDVVVPPANQEIALERIPGASLVWFPDGGHGFMWQAPNRTAAFVKAFLLPDS